MNDDPAMLKAYEAARLTFKYFWRELSWESRRIVKGLDLAIVKLPFTDGPRDNGNPKYEPKWVAEVDFDGDQVASRLLNTPLAKIGEGDAICIPFAEVCDWLMTASL